MSRIFTPSNQVQLTNVSVVRLKRAGKRFEVACYKNKVMDWRSGIEADLDEVLQTHSIFNNVSKGQVANKDDLKKAFKELSLDESILEILRKGELQVGEKERSAQLESTSKDIATIISDKCVDANTNRPFTVSMIEKAMLDIHYSVSKNKSAKQQSLDVIRLLQEQKTISIEPAKLRIRAILPSKDGKRVKIQLHDLCDSIEEEDWSEDYEMVCLVEPGRFKALNELIQQETKGRGQIQVLSVKKVLHDESL